MEGARREPGPGEAAAPPAAVDDLRSSVDSLRDQLLDGLPARVQGMAEELMLEWSAAVEAVPELARVATAEVIRLLRMAPSEREATLRRRYARLHGEDPPEVGLIGTHVPSPRQAAG
ncbi:MAG: hypothetical protein QOE72_1766 [Chloroflexota bacterium]|jgi:hypothetical protein|nr:hypothetical protein [Chloroflexota bacterium]